MKLLPLWGSWRLLLPHLKLLLLLLLLMVWWCYWLIRIIGCRGSTILPCRCIPCTPLLLLLLLYSQVHALLHPLHAGGAPSYHGTRLFGSFVLGAD